MCCAYTAASRFASASEHVLISRHSANSISQRANINSTVYYRIYQWTSWETVVYRMPLRIT